MNGNTNETGNYLFLFAPTTFVGFSLARLWRLIVWFSAHMDRWFFTCLHIKHSLWFSFKVFCQHFLAPIDNWLLLSVFHIMRDPKQTNIFYGQMFMQYLIDVCHTIIQRFLNLAVCRMTILPYQLSNNTDIFWHNNGFFANCTEFVLDQAPTSINLLYQLFTVL